MLDGMRVPSPPRTRLRVAAAIALVVTVPASRAGTHVQRQQIHPLVVRVDGGFRWGDAAVGSAAGFGVGLILAGGLALAGRRERGWPHTDRFSRRTP